MADFDPAKEAINLSKHGISLARWVDHVQHPWRRHASELRHGSGLGFIAKVFFLALRQLLSISSSKEP